MASGQYGQYSGNPYGGSGASNPYGGNSGAGDYDGGHASNPYSGGGNLNAPAPLSQQASNYSQASQYSAPPSGPGASQSTVLSNQDFLNRVEGVKGSIRSLTSSIGQIGALHQRALADTGSSTSSQLESLVSETQILNNQIKDQIKFLETDAKRSGNNTTKDSQVRSLKQTFQSQLEEFRREEQSYSVRYRDQISRQYRIVNPEASEEEVQEAANANWGDEGVFQTALRSNRTGHAQSVLRTVRARHNDIQQIEKTLIELNQLFQDLNQQVILEEATVEAIENQTQQVTQDTEAANVQLTKGVDSARRARKLKWWCLGITILIIAIIAIALGVVFGRPNK